MNLRTFLPPPSLEIAAPPEVGDRAPSGLTDGPAVVAFLRHTGCPFSEATMRALREVDAVQVIAVSHAPADATAKWCDAIGGAGDVRLVIDPTREQYAAWGLGRSSLGHFMGRRSLAAVGRQAKRGIRNRHPHGTRWQQAGTFAIDAAGVVRWRHLPAHAGDLPDLAAAASSAVTSAPADASSPG